MKSYMPNPLNLEALKADKRFDALVKQQKAEHEHVIASHNKEMQELRDALKLAIEKMESLSQKNEQDLKEFKAYTLTNIGLLKEKIATQDVVIDGQKKMIGDLFRQVLDFHVHYSSKDHVNQFKKEVGEQMKHATMSHITAFQECERACKSLFQVLHADLEKLRADMEKKVEMLAAQDENNFTIFRIDKEGVLQEMLKYKKTVFYIEKKIENIYTLIERINNSNKNSRGAA